MFTGIITTTAKIIAIDTTADIYSITLEYLADDIAKSESIAIDGICLNVTSHNEHCVSFDIYPDIFKTSNFSLNKIVNIERATRFSDDRRGHFITGKIDQLAIVQYSKVENNKVQITVGGINTDQLEYLAPNCDIAVNGVSLSVKKITNSTLSISISPSIIAQTNLKLLRPEDIIHIEYCIVAKNINKETVYHLQHIETIN